MCLAVPGRIAEVWREGQALLSWVDSAGTRRRVCLDAVGEAAVGDYVIVHAGYALTRLDAGEAASVVAMMTGEGLLPDSTADGPRQECPPDDDDRPAADGADVSHGGVCRDDVCVTCSDEGRPGEVVAAPSGAWDPAVVRTDTGIEEVDVTLVGAVVPGDRVLIHAGTAIGRLDPASEVAR
ncbi:MAG: HypC/HybG/HupF family hydrogenase formation chaperone [Bifidobacteriaceae bacterium]|jgi:hydrogenase assembly chaperone HypC/HupF|nr:HypC/HybG/HupF family hydrogenase formation chaperone [Bifidobacteriaceae bacterium]